LEEIQQSWVDNHPIRSLHEIKDQAPECLAAGTCPVAPARPGTDNASMIRKMMVLIVWLGALLTPPDWIGKALVAARQVVGLAYRSEAGHVIGHLTLYAVLAALVLHLLGKPRGWAAAVILGVVVLATGLAQEAVQLQVKGRAFGGPEVFDLGVDLAGAWLGWWVYWRLASRARYLWMAYYLIRGT
jgi:hypothetical protein